MSHNLLICSFVLSNPSAKIKDTELSKGVETCRKNNRLQRQQKQKQKQKQEQEQHTAHNRTPGEGLDNKNVYKVERFVTVRNSLASFFLCFP